MANFDVGAFQTSAIDVGAFQSASGGGGTLGGAVTLRPFQANASGAVSPISGTAAVTLRAFTASGTGAVPESGTVDVTLRAFTCAGQGIGGTNSSKLGMLLGVG